MELRRISDWNVEVDVFFVAIIAWALLLTFVFVGCLVATLLGVFVVFIWRVGAHGAPARWCVVLHDGHLWQLASAC